MEGMTGDITTLLNRLSFQVCGGVNDVSLAASVSQQLRDRPER
jgi:hypothetical protein